MNTNTNTNTNDATTTTTKRYGGRGNPIPADVRKQALHRVRKGERVVAVAAALSISPKTIHMWKGQETAHRRAPKRSAKIAKASRKAVKRAITHALQPHLTEIGLMLKKSFPDLTRFSLTTQNGKTTIDYAVRQVQVSEHVGAIKL